MSTAKRGPSNPPTCENILRGWDCASLMDYEDGASWYEDANRIARECPLGPNVGAGILAAFSPMISWKRNVELARAAWSKPLSPFPRNGPWKYTDAVRGHTSITCRKVEGMLRGLSPESLLRGHKVRAFYRAIRDSGTHHVVVDRHAVCVVAGRKSVNVAKLLSQYGYWGFVSAYCDAAAVLGVPPSVVQAVTWVTWRRTGRRDQPALFRRLT